MEASAWWSPEQHARRRRHLLARGRIKSALRSWFEAQDFLETECGALVASPGNEAHLHAFQTQYVTESGQIRTLYLHTSPEFAMKKLLAAGETRLFDFARAYRNREVGGRHSPEFTMLEWYRAGAVLADVMNDCAVIARAAAEAAGTSQLVWKGKTCDPLVEPEWLTLAEAFDRYAGIDLTLHLEDAAAFRRAALSAGIGVPEGATWTDVFSAILVTKIEPHLGMGRLTFLHRYPLSEAALSRPAPDDPRFAERFELYACGVELANGYRELTDAGQLVIRQQAEMDLKEAVYGERYPLDPDFIAAVAAMPEASGVALGFDRLVMLASGAGAIQDVLWTPPALEQAPRP